MFNYALFSEFFNLSFYIDNNLYALCILVYSIIIHNIPIKL